MKQLTKRVSIFSPRCLAREIMYFCLIFTLSFYKLDHFITENIFSIASKRDSLQKSEGRFTPKFLVPNMKHFGVHILPLFVR